MLALRRRQLSSAGLLAAGTLVSCGALFGFDPSQRRLNGVAGEGGVPGGAGDDSRAGTGTGGTGTGGDGATNGGAGASGEAGAAGVDTSGMGGGGTSAGGTSAGGTSAGGTSAPKPGERCESNREKSCWANAVLECEDGVWTVVATCREAHGCNPATWTCAPFTPDCAAHREGLCVSTSLIDCASNPFTPPERVCPFGCASGACLPGTGDQLIVHTERHFDVGEPWSGDIPVCFASDPGANLRRWIQSAVEQGWTRYVDVAFTGWGECDSDSRGVILEFPEDCRGRIASAVRARTRDDIEDDVAQHVGICRSYLDAGGEPHELDENEALARFVARHQFGHVLGLLESDIAGVPSVMVRGVRSAHVDSTVWAEDIRPFWPGKHYKPEASIVSPSGSCLDALATVGLWNCSGSASQRFLPLADRIEVSGGRGCLGVSGDAAGAAQCSTIPAANSFALRRARWSAPGYCVAPRELPVTPGALLVTKPCTAVGEASQTWAFDIVGVNAEAGRPAARIRFVAEDYCVSIAEPFRGAGDVPTLAPCGTADAVFVLGPGGDVSKTVPGPGGQRFCLDWYGSSVLHFRACNGRPFLLTGPLETPGGLALSTVLDEPSDAVFVVELAPDALPDAGEVFDVHF
jgi:hypothetical protein